MTTTKSGEFAGLPLSELPKSSSFTSKLPADPQFPTPASSAAADREHLGPRMVRSALFTYVAPDPVESEPELLATSSTALRDLGIASADTKTPEFVNLLAGNGPHKAEDKVYPWAQCYGGWQFGSWAGQLGDGRAISLFETTNPSTGKRFELQLKGAGRTPYSRFADGKAVLRSSIREFLVSEYLNAIGIPSTRALSLTLLPSQRAVRERIEPCAIVARFAESWIRIGTFDLPRSRNDRKTLRKLADYVIEEVLHLPEATGKDRYLRMYREIVRLNALTVAKWQVHGFMNGVLNTDNTSVLGLSLDFGPFAFMDAFDPIYTPNHDDYALRYSFKNQPTIVWWNLVRLAEDLAELITVEDPDDAGFVEDGIKEEEKDAFVEKAQKVIEGVGEMYREVFIEEYRNLMAERMGFKELRKEDMDDVFSPTLDLMEDLALDFHHFFRKISASRIPTSPDERRQLAKSFLPSTTKATPENIDKLSAWLELYADRLAKDNVEEDERMQKMKRLNPKFVPKNFVLDEIIKRVEKDGDREVLQGAVEMCLNPCEEEWGWDREAEERWCGEVPVLARGSQCSCSS